MSDCDIYKFKLFSDYLQGLVHPKAIELSCIYSRSNLLLPSILQHTFKNTTNNIKPSPIELKNWT